MMSSPRARLHAAAMAIATVLAWVLRKFDFEATHQALHFRPHSRDTLDRF